MLMVVGACAGSTGGGFKCARVLLLWKRLRRTVRQALNPRKVMVVRSGDKIVSEQTVANVGAYLAAYVFIVVVSFLLVSLDSGNVETSFSAVLACFNNIGPGMAAVGPMCNYGWLNPLSKSVLALLMLAGRLEIFPILVLFSRSTWKK